MPIVMKLAPCDNGVQSPELNWRYLQSADVESYGGRGEINLTSDIKRAMRFDDTTKALEFWKQQSMTRPTRPDGKPNRPLTAYHATFEEVE